MVLIALIAAVVAWLGLLTVVVGMCAGAARGDEHLGRALLGAADADGTMRHAGVRPRRPAARATQRTASSAT